MFTRVCWFGVDRFHDCYRSFVQIASSSTCRTLLIVRKDHCFAAMSKTSVKFVIVSSFQFAIVGSWNDIFYDSSISIDYNILGVLYMMMPDG